MSQRPTAKVVGLFLQAQLIRRHFKVQKLSKRSNTYTPTDTSLVRGNCDLELNNSEGRNSVQGLKTFDNTSEENRQQHRVGSNLRVLNIVYVKSMRGLPLMPTTQSISRRLLKCKKAHVVKRFPFTIQMDIPTGENKQEIICGVDTGYKNIAISCTTVKKEVFSAEIITDQKTKQRLEEKRMYRKGRRNKLWYRKPRFLNRGKAGWLPPSILRRYNLHISFVENLKKVLPISRVIFELGQFDIQKMENVDITNIEYQKGDLFGYNNIKEYLLNRENGKCQLCGKDKKEGFQIHHIEQRSNGGSNRLDNLALVHKSCHAKVHREEIQLKCSKPKSYKEATFMNIIRSKVLKETDYDITQGYITNTKRYKLGLEKSHLNDAFVIANGGYQERCLNFNIQQKHRNNRGIQLNRKGFKPAIRKQRYANQPGDLVKYNGKEYNVKGTHNKGKTVILKNLVKNINANIKKLVEVFHFGSLIWNIDPFKGGIATKESWKSINDFAGE